jgi:hypothetical protein
MGVDVVATAKAFEQHAEKGYRPEYLASELHNLSDADRLAVAKQIEWDIRHQTNPNLPKIEFYDTGDLKAVETTSKSGESKFVEHYELDKKTSKIKSELKTTNTDNSYEHYSNVEYTERDANGHATYKYDTSLTVHGTKVSSRTEEDRWVYDPKTGKQVSHDETTSEGRKLHEEFDPQTGKAKFADETGPKGNWHRTYDATTGKVQQEDIVYPDKSQETRKYNSNGDKVYSEKRYGNNGDRGTRTWTYNPRTEKPVYTEWHGIDGKVEKNNVDENGKWTLVKD